MAKTEILLIEDDDIDAMNIERAFKDCWPSAVVIRARDGQNALDILEDFRPTIVLLDLSMPGLHGFEVLSEIKNREGLLGIPVIVCSGSDEPEDIKTSYRNHANAYTVKPGSIDGYRDLVTGIKAFWSVSASLQPAYLI